MEIFTSSETMVNKQLNMALTNMAMKYVFKITAEHTTMAVFVLNNFRLIDATDRSKISSDQKCFFIAISLYPLSFFANTPFNDIHL